MISARTKAALAAAKTRGIKLGGDRGGLNQDARRAGNQGSAKVRRVRATQRANNLMPVLARLRAQGARSAQALARGLNEEGVPTVSGRGQWQANSVLRVLRRIEPVPA
jgi:DNA invertase Pin-like site-specific DNA recombinase